MVLQKLINWLIKTHDFTKSDNLLNQKQPIITNISGTGIDLLTSNELRRIFGSDGISASIYLNVNDANDPKNYNIQISGSSLQNSINSLTTSVNTNSVDILALDSTVSAGFLARYTKTESDNRYYTQSEINTDIKNRFYVFNGGSYTVLNIQHSYGINLAVTSSTNPSSSEILLKSVNVSVKLIFLKLVSPVFWTVIE